MSASPSLRHLILLPLLFALPASASAAVAGYAAPGSLRAALSAIGPVGRPAPATVAGRRPETTYLMRLNKSTLEKRLEKLYLGRTLLPGGTYVLGFTKTSWGEVHAYLGRGYQGQVVRFVPSGAGLRVHVESIIRKPGLAVGRARRRCSRSSFTAAERCAGSGSHSGAGASNSSGGPRRCSAHTGRAAAESRRGGAARARAPHLPGR